MKAILTMGGCPGSIGGIGAYVAQNRENTSPPKFCWGGRGRQGFGGVGKCARVGLKKGEPVCWGAK